MKKKIPLALLGNTAAVSTPMALATSNGLTQAEKTFLGKWHESKLLRGSGSMKVKDQQQKDSNPSPKWYFMAIKEAARICRLVRDALAIQAHWQSWGGEHCPWGLFMKAALCITNIPCVIFTWHNSF